MKYFVIEISEGDNAIKGKAVYEYETLNDAVATFHQKMSTAMRSPLFTSELVVVMDEEGKVVKREKYEVPTEVKTPTDEASAE